MVITRKTPSLESSWMTDQTWQRIVPLAEGVHGIEEGGYVRFYVVVGSQRTAVIDTGFGVTDPRPLIESLGKSPWVVINTHVHPDHSNGNRWFAEATAMGRVEWQVHGRKWNANTHRIPDGGWRPSQMMLGSEYADRLPEAFDADTYDQWVAQGLPEPAQLLDDGQVIDLGDVRLDVWHTPSHTRGHLCLYEPKRRLLFAGDAVASPGPVWLHLKCRATKNQIDQTYQRLAQQADRVAQIYPAHGQTPVSGAFLKEFYEGLQRVRCGEVTGKEVQTMGVRGIRYELGGWGMILSHEDAG